MLRVLDQDRPLRDGADRTAEDDELVALALDGDPDAPIDPDAVNLWQVVDPGTPRLLPAWYMPGPMPRTRPIRGWRRRIAWLIVLSFLAISAAGLCSTYGIVEIA